MKQKYALIWIVFTWQQESVTSEDVPKNVPEDSLSFCNSSRFEKLEKTVVKIGIFLLMVPFIGEDWRRFEQTRREDAVIVNI